MEDLCSVRIIVTDFKTKKIINDLSLDIQKSNSENITRKQLNFLSVFIEGLQDEIRHKYLVDVDKVFKH